MTELQAISSAPPLVWVVLCGLVGLVVGSFIAVASLRMPAGRPIVMARSACDGCAKPLSAVELIPVLSVLMLRGRCSACGAAIAPRHLVLELAGAAIGVWAAIVQPDALALVSAALGWQLLLLAVLDGEHLWLPRSLTLPLIASGLLAAILVGPDALLARGIGAIAGFAALWAISAIYRRLRGREGLGGGDAYLFAGAGAWVGWTGLSWVLMAAALTGLLFALFPLLRGRRPQPDRPIPFGPFLAVGAWLVWLYAPLG